MISLRLGMNFNNSLIISQLRNSDFDIFIFIWHSHLTFMVKQSAVSCALRYERTKCGKCGTYSNL